MGNHFFAYMSRMKHIKRWSLMRNSWQEDIAQHSLQVAMIAHTLALYKNARYGGGANPERAATLAMYHEAPEVITGDIATPIKYFNPEIRANFGTIEVLAAKKLHTMIPQDIRSSFDSLILAPEEDPEWKRVKAADTLSAYIKCVEETKAGNAEFYKAARETRQKLESLHMQEVDAFMQECLPSFMLTLDELD